MKKTLQAIAVGTLVFSGLGISHDADAKAFKETRLNYLNKDVIKKVKAGKIKSLDGYKLGTSLAELNKQRKLNSIIDDPFDYRSIYSITVGNSDNTAYIDLCDIYCTGDNVVTRLVDNVVSDLNRSQLTRKKLLKLYGTPSKSNQKYINSGNTKYRIDYYKHATFVYSAYDNDPFVLESVQYFGKELSKHKDRFTRLIKYDEDNFSENHLDHSIFIDEWETI